MSHEKSHALNLIGNPVSWTVESAKPRNVCQTLSPSGSGNETSLEPERFIFIGLARAARDAVIIGHGMATRCVYADRAALQQLRTI